MSYTVELSRTALKALRDLTPQINRRILSALEKLVHDPRPNGSKKLQGDDKLYRIRIGDYRVIYGIDDVIRVVDVKKIGHRGDIYQ